MNTRKQCVVYEIKILKQYKRNYKKLKQTDKDLVDSIVFKLASGEKLEKKHNDHKLKGEFRDFRECHIKPDLLLVYQKNTKELILTCINIGSHSKIF